MAQVPRRLWLLERHQSAPGQPGRYVNSTQTLSAQLHLLVMQL